jgi:leucine-rich repeat protein SHOC2
MPSLSNLIPATSSDFAGRDFEEFPQDIFSQPNVNWLILSHNKLREVPPSIKMFGRLTRLALNDNRIEVVTPLIGELSSLTWVDLTRNRLSFLPYEMGKLKNLTGLGLSENDFTEIPECVLRLHSLKKFGFFSNRLVAIPKDIHCLRGLVKVDLSNNLIEELPDEFCELTNLTWLNLSNNKIARLPAGLNKLVNLEELGLGSNLLEEVPDISALTRLRILPLFKNRIKRVNLKTDSLPRIEKLDFSDNEVCEFPTQVIYMKGLRYLNFKNNKIREINFNDVDPTVISNISMIDVSDNLLTYIPLKFFKTFSNITTIRMNNNPFRYHQNIRPKTVPSLLGLCYAKIFNLKGCVGEVWINTKFRKSLNTCDGCGKTFFNEPYERYNLSSLGDGNTFVVKKILCSCLCYKREYK